jgi:quinol-cytochrome oxidoreductase complex cytochrome b subunit
MDIQKITQSKAWKSVFRTGIPRSNLDRSLLIFNNLFLHVQPVKVREKAIRFTYTFYLGFISFWLFVILSITGILLMLYYHPSIPQAYRDMKDLEFVVSSGKFLRNLHRWSAHSMVFIVFLHMLRVFYKRAFQSPREFNWVVGVMLFVFTLLLSFTGYLLPWDQLSIWAVTVGTNMVRATPVMGEKVRFLLLGGNIIGENALVRFYVLHCVIIPLVMALGISIHFWRIRKDGGLK